MNKQSGIGLIMVLIVVGVIAGLAVTLLLPKKEEVVETIPEISDVQGLNTVSTELDNTNPDDLNTELNQLNQYYSAF